ncbi:MAG: chloride channel protein, partial [Candidatus Zixiibacteriota bacterium]
MESDATRRPTILESTGDRIASLVEKSHLSEQTILIILAFVVGLSTGFVALLFRFLIHFFYDLFFGRGEQLFSQITTNWQIFIPLIPALGGLLVGPIVSFFSSEAKGHGVPEVMLAVAAKGGIIRPRVAVAKSVASSICIGSGGSAGREGPIVQIGSAVGSTIGQYFRMSDQRIKVLVGCGAAGGISAVFNAPIAGVFFALEIILGDFAIHTFGPVVLSSVIASVVTHAFLGNYPAFSVPHYELLSVAELPMYLVLGGLCGLFSVLYIVTLYRAEDFFEDKVKIPGYLKPALGGLLLGIIGVFFPQVFKDGYEFIKQALYSEMALWLMSVLIFLKILATSLTLGSGNSGGIFAPSLFIGSMAGGSFGKLMHWLFPAVTASSGAYALVGMGAVVAGATHAPITAMVIIFEMTGDYRIILPLMLACAFSALLTRRLKPESIYTLKLVRRGITLKGGRDIEVLSSIYVKEVMNRHYQTIPQHMTLGAIWRLMEDSRQECFPVTDENGRFLGMVSLQDLRTIITREGMDNLIIARDI